MANSNTRQGRFITFEGMDGAGKSTHITTVTRQIKAQGYQVIATREPGGTPLGEKLRDILLHDSMYAETEALLMFAARYEHLNQVIKPALAKGIYVISDRFTDASYAYQCGAKGVAIEKIAQLETWVQDDFQPDLTLLFDVPAKVSAQRLANTRKPDKFERENLYFFNKLRTSYLQRAKECPDRFCVIDANQPLDKVTELVKVIIEDKLISN